MIASLLRRWADAALVREATDLKQKLDTTQRELAVTEAERDTLAAVVVRERARVEAETAIYNRNRAEAEGLRDEQSTSESIRRLGT